jgi:hypothetical protein
MMAYGFHPLSMPNRWQECAGMSGLRLNSSRQSDGPAKPWMWSLAYGQHEDRTPTHGYEPTREAAMQAFARSWNRD